MSPTPITASKITATAAPPPGATASAGAAPDAAAVEGTGAAGKMSLGNQAMMPMMPLQQRLLADTTGPLRCDGESMKVFAAADATAATSDDNASDKANKRSAYADHRDGALSQPEQDNDIKDADPDLLPTANPERLFLAPTITKTITISPGRLSITVKFEKGYGGAIITRIREGCLFKQCISEGDIIATLNGREVTSQEDFTPIVNGKSGGQLLIVPKEAVGSGVNVFTIPPGSLGITVEFKENEAGAVVTEIHEHCPFKTYIAVGDRILAVNERGVTSVEDFNVDKNAERTLTVLPNGVDERVSCNVMSRVDEFLEGRGGCMEERQDPKRLNILHAMNSGNFWQKGDNEENIKGSAMDGTEKDVSPNQVTKLEALIDSFLRRRCNLNEVSVKHEATVASAAENSLHAPFEGAGTDVVLENGGMVNKTSMNVVDNPFLPTFVKLDPKTEDEQKRADFAYAMKDSLKVAQIGPKEPTYLSAMSSKSQANRRSLTDWDKFYGELTEHYRCNGANALVQKDHNPQLVSWTYTQRSAYKKGKLTKRREQLLRKIGFDFSPGAAQLSKINWDNKLRNLNKYLQEHNGKIPSSDVTDPELKKVRSWVLNQMKKMKSGELPGERALELMQAFVIEEESNSQRKKRKSKGKRLRKGENELHQPLKKKQPTASDDESLRSEGEDHEDLDPWERNFKALSHHFKSKGTTAKIPNGELSKWVTAQKSLYKEYTSDAKQKITRLESIGFSFEWRKKGLPCTVWDKRYNELAEHYKLNGAGAHVSKEMNFDLQNWIQQQRCQYKHERLDMRKVELLSQIGFDFSSQFQITLWDRSFEKLSDYLREHNGRIPPRDTKDPEHRKIREWVMYQKKKIKNGELSDERVYQLMEILEAEEEDLILGACGGAVDDQGLDQWEKMYGCLVDYKAENQHTCVPISYMTERHGNLGLWAARQRLNKATLSDERVGKLVKLGFDFHLSRPLEQQHAVWEGKLKDYIRYKKSNQGKDPTGENSLSSWCSIQRKEFGKGSLRQEQMDSLREAGFAFCSEKKTKKCDQWPKYYEELKSFYLKNGHCRVPHKDADPSLLGWIRRQMRKCKTSQISEERLKLLKDINFAFVVDTQKISIDWDEKLMDFIKYKTTNEGEETIGKSLGAWCRRQRKKYINGTLTQDQIDSLRKARFVFEDSASTQIRDQWPKYYEELKSFYQEHGHCEAVSTDVSSSLLDWMMTQRKNYKNSTLTDDQLKLLQDIKFSFERTERGHQEALLSWERRLGLIARFYQSHGHSDMKAEDPSLANWIVSMKDSYSLSKKRKQELLQVLRGDAAPCCYVGCEMIARFDMFCHDHWCAEQKMILEMDADEWEEMFGKIVQFYEANGHFNIGKADPRLDIWMKVASSSSKLSDLQRMQLELLKVEGRTRCLKCDKFALMSGSCFSYCSVCFSRSLNSREGTLSNKNDEELSAPPEKQTDKEYSGASKTENALIPKLNLMGAPLGIWCEGDGSNASNCINLPALPEKEKEENARSKASKSEIKVKEEVEDILCEKAERSC